MQGRAIIDFINRCVEKLYEKLFLLFNRDSITRSWLEAYLNEHGFTKRLKYDDVNSADDYVWDYKSIEYVVSPTSGQYGIWVIVYTELDDNIHQSMATTVSTYASCKTKTDVINSVHKFKMNMLQYEKRKLERKKEELRKKILNICKEDI